ncbi:OmpA family protein [Paraglaciecola arctica]|uniref:OmpA-OmpF porin, OOP family n=1 Tax=Paraglaciecola arctica BSs20135 TaxID=493475 RepID=K6XH88_9ALTE|nr:OmpA family protein [Paraglaciecola arctica]GAC20014.1 OmpA-OmpF porin, OOP family [Paraglaciecola arctica BSs20135]
MKKLLILSAITAALSANVQAQEQPKENDKWVAGFVEYYSADNSAKDSPNFLNDGYGFGAEFGMKFSEEWGARVELSFLEIDVEGAFLDESGKRLGADLLYFMPEDLLYVFGGLKNTKITDADMMASVGLGKHWDLGKHLDLGKYQAYGNNVKIVTELAAYQNLDSHEDGTHLGFKVGIAYAFGGSTAPSMPKDSDNDGVLDSQDQCANTPIGTAVDSIGCTLDLDGDGVINRLDNCPDTPAGTEVDSYGCKNDLDGDGIPNNIDMCPNTAPGTQVGAKGCSLILDTDQDGILDDVDNCSDTPLTDKVDAKGCSIFTEEEVSINVKVLFANNSSVIGNSNASQFQEVADFMDRYPATDAVIEGHASAPGSDDYNLMLSQKRANAVRTLLIQKYGIKAERLIAIGYGETQLLDTANTAEANQANRRIVVKVSASTRVNVKR